MAWRVSGLQQVPSHNFMSCHNNKQMSSGVDLADRRHDPLDNYKKIENYLYSCYDKLGEGNFSEVYRGQDQTTGRRVAVKVVKYSSLTSKVAQQLLKNEVVILRDLQHDNVVRCYDVFTSKNNCYIVTQFCEGGDLDRQLEKRRHFHEKDIAHIIYGVYKGLLYLHEAGVVHRDLKPANILLTAGGVPKIADFGFAVKCKTTFKDINIGSPIYMSPEGMLKYEYGPKSEVWSLGVMVYELLHGYAPLSLCKNQKQLKQSILLPPSFKEGISAQMRRFIQTCLVVDVKARASIPELIGTAYLSRMAREIQANNNKDLYSTYSTMNQIKNSFGFVKDITAYSDGLAVLHYCRLVHKVTEFCKSTVLSGWLLQIITKLQQIKLADGSHTQNANLISTINKYWQKYQRLHSEPKYEITHEEVIFECEKIKQAINNKAVKYDPLLEGHLTLLNQETGVLARLGESRGARYSQITQIEKYLNSMKNYKE